MKQRPTTRSHNISDDELYEYALIILKSMREERVLFPDPHPDLDSFEKRIEEFNLAAIEAKNRDRRAVLIRDQKKEILQQDIRFLSFYVQTIAKGDEGIIVASGFVPSKRPDSSEQIPSPSDFKLIPEIGSKAMKLQVKAWRSARVYQFEYRKKGEDQPWTTVLSSKSRHTIQHLEHLQEYEFRVCYVGRTGNSAYSNVLSSLVY